MKTRLLALICIVLMSTTQVFAAHLDGGYAVYYNGVEQNLLDVNSNQVAPITLNGVMYLPVRPVMDLIGQHVEWSESDRTIYITDGGMAYDYRGDSDLTDKDIDVSIDNSVSVVYHDQRQDVKVIMYKGSAYVPLQGIRGCDISLDNKKETVNIRSARK